MTAAEYFGDWIKVIDDKQLTSIMKWLKRVNVSTLCPSPSNIFRAFRLCPLKDCKAVFLGQDPYPQKGVATGILFGNSTETPEDSLSPSLQVIKESIINYEVPHGRIEFDNSLESLATQGILMINTALTCEINKVGIHFNIWKPFMSSLLYNLSKYNNSLAYILFGNQASLFKENITRASIIIETYHPAYYARRGEKMPYSVFTDFNSVIEGIYGERINFYKEYGTY